MKARSDILTAPAQKPTVLIQVPIFTLIIKTNLTALLAVVEKTYSSYGTKSATVMKEQN